jgi:hypothetical protein
MTEHPEISSTGRIKADERAQAHQFESGRAALAPRVICAIALGLAICSVVIVVTVRLIRCFQPDLLPWTLKSAIPLILIGIAFASLQFALPRTHAQILLGLMVSAAFILWGAEQFLSNPAIVAFIDDIVVLLFVMDLSIVIYGHLKPGVHPVSKELPFDEPGG